MTAPWGSGLAWDPLVTFAYEAITATGGGAAVTPTAATVAGNSTGHPAKRGVFTIETGQVRYRCDNTAPTATVGVPADPGAEITVYGNDVRLIQFIASAGVTATIHAQYAR